MRARRQFLAENLTPSPKSMLNPSSKEEADIQRVKIAVTEISLTYPGTRTGRFEMHSRV